MVTIGPVQMLAVEFGPDAKFAGKIIEELESLERFGFIRVIDLLFIHKEPDGTISGRNYQAEGMGTTIAALLGLETRTLREVEALEEMADEGYPFGLSVDDIREMASELDPGTSAGFVLLEHVWARTLRRVIREAGGKPVAEGFLTPETLGPVAAEIAEAVRALDAAAAEETSQRHARRRLGRL
ncbi:DUF1269 domain-containing protein [Streptomyces sp. NBC_01381]|uniref:DUF1269 domain-containing protein n=1 Tax=Streptomyces sp. NBC_01381 TaxID=2903845 RepID=UPI00225094CA|nr:DUF1269 domain-containing protein [Streptomyces sp. NBC_01381]MCX4672268.1 DUF1269 domain-containing protein [Streptomyces sp. NBC_01381]